MKLASYVHAKKPGYGIVVDGGLVDLTRRVGAKWPTLGDALQAGELADIESSHAGQKADFGIDEVTFLPPVTAPGKIICIGLNYRAHINEMGSEEQTHPVLFVRFIDSLVGHGEAMVRPKASKNYDYEGELAVIIGKTARHVAKDDALDYVAGYSCFNDGSLRDYQRHTRQFTGGKNFWRSGAFGPWMVTRGDLPDPSALTLKTRINGEELQNSSTGNLIFPIGDLIAYITTIMPLNAGDVIATGTPSGVGGGREPKLWMKPGDDVEVEISGVGVLRNSVVDET